VHPSTLLFLNEGCIPTTHLDVFPDYTVQLMGAEACMASAVDYHTQFFFMLLFVNKGGMHMVFFSDRPQKEEWLKICLVFSTWAQWNQN